MMMPRHALIACITMALCSTRPTRVVSADAAPAFEIDDLGSLGGPGILTKDINDAGDVVGTAQSAGGTFHAFLYTDSDGIRDLATVLGPGTSSALGVNNRRHVVGYFTRADGSTGAFLFGDEIGLIDLGRLPGNGDSLAAGINDADQVTGSSWAATGWRAFVWSASTGMVDIGSLGGAMSNGQRINIRAQVVGQSMVNDDPTFPVFHAFRYADGIGMQDLGTLPGTSRTGSSAYGINADADAVGYSSDPAFSLTHAFLYTDRDGMRDLGTLGGRLSIAYGINDGGGVVGITALESGVQHPFLYTGAGGMIDLNGLIDPASGWTLWTADAVSNRGTVIGFGTKAGAGRGYRARRIRDDSAPEIEPTVTPSPNAAGWNATDVTVSWRVRDPESGIASSSGCETQPFSDSTVGVTVTCTASNPFGGVTSRSVMVKIDESAPLIAATLNPSPNAAGWNSGDVAVAWSVTDPESGVASSTGCIGQTVTTETAGTTLSCTATNQAGLSSTRSVTVKLDKTPPVATCTATPSILWPPNGAMVPVSIAVSVFDALSGPGAVTLQSIAINDRPADAQTVTGFQIGSGSTTGFVQAARGGNEPERTYTFTYQASDVAGLTALCTATVTVPHDSSQ
jgi:probable HAF family extracellular repeat protein